MTKHRARSSNSARRRRNEKPLFYHDTEFDRYFVVLPYRARSRADAPLYRVVTLVRVGDRADWAWIGCATRGDKRALLAYVGRESSISTPPGTSRILAGPDPAGISPP